MKFITITGGLGNQLFVYAFYLELKARGKKAMLFVPFKNNSRKYGHQGYELEKLFHIPNSKTFTDKLKYTLLVAYSHLLRIFPAAWKPKLYRLIGIYTINAAENFIYYPEIFDFKHKNELFRGTWQSEKYFANAKDIVCQTLIFDKSLLSAKSIKLREQMKNENSVSIHIRRGDYLSDRYVSGFSGVCTPEYYTTAIQQLKDKIEDIVFYVFTDDKEWVKENFIIDNIYYVTHNNDSDSWQDMYLMSKCKHNIIANSSFSWWGAWLNKNPDKIVIAPKKWWASIEKDDVVPDEWLRF